MAPRTAGSHWRARLAGLVATALLLAACTNGAGESGAPPGADQAAEAPSCRHDGLPADDQVLRTGPDPAQVATAVAEATHRCSPVAVIAPTDDDWTPAMAAAVARGADAPLLLVDPTRPDAIRPVLDRLEVTEVVAVGVDGTSLAGEERTVTSLAPPSPPATTTTPPGGQPPTTGATPSTEVPSPDAASSAAPSPDATSAAPSPEASPPAAPSPAAPSPWRVAMEVAAHLGADRYLAVPIDDASARAASGAHLDAGTAVLPLPTDPAEWEAVAAAVGSEAEITVLASDPAVAEAAVAALIAAGLRASPSAEALWTEGPAGTAWLVDPAQGPVAAVAATAAASRGEPVLPVTASDLRSGRERTSRVRRLGPERAVLVGDVTAEASWQLPLITSGPELPGGGFRLFEDQRMVALYGHPGHAVLGALGEQDLDTTVERVRAVAAPYGADGATVLPAFELITTVASAEAGVLGDYSRRTPIEVLRPYIDRAAAEDIYVILDLQPGRTDFLTQAQEYEELLREPHVGLALDPEWRLLPDQVHLRQVGSVAAAEVQQVVDWLAALTRQHQLPEKLLVLHQFRLTMLPDRDTVVDPPELAMVVHMDGQGPIGSKDGTYRALTAGAEERWLWGWKNFYDEDEPTPTPDHVLSRDPVPVFVTYQ